jgi:hypothetical protein
MRKKTLSVLAIAALFSALALAGHDSKAEAERELLSYCERVAQFEAEKARGVPLEFRNGHRDWRDDINVAEDCPGMRPAR